MARKYNPLLPYGFDDSGESTGGGSGTVQSVSVTPANGVSATVTNPTTTPNLSFTLGAITPNSVVASGILSGNRMSLSGAAPDVVFNQSGGNGFNTFSFQRDGVTKIAIGRDFGNNFYVTRSNDGITYFDNTFKILLASGFTGINKAVPTEFLDVGGTVRAEGYKSSDGTPGATITAGGITTKNGLVTAISPGVMATITKTASYTATSDDYTIRGNASSGSITITLPTSGISAGKIFVIKKIDATNNTVVIGGTVDGVVNQSIATQYGTVSIQWNGSTYDKLSQI